MPSLACCAKNPILLMMPWLTHYDKEELEAVWESYRSGFPGGGCQGDSMERRSLDFYQIALLLTFGKLRVHALEVQR